MSDRPIPTIVIDELEPNNSEHGRKDGTPLPFNCPTEVYKLFTGDYSIKGLESMFSVEKKTINDLIGSITGKRGRDEAGNTKKGTSRREVFQRELVRLNAMRFAMLLVIGNPKDIQSGNYHSSMNPKAAWNTIEAYAVQYPKIKLQFVPDEAAAARCIEKWASWFAYQLVKDYGRLVKGSPHFLKKG